jgi:hypothetical protein
MTDETQMTGQVTIEVPSAWGVQPIKDGSLTALVFKVKAGAVGFAMTHENMSRYAGQILTSAGKQAREHPPEKPPQTYQTTPVPVNALAIDPHPDDPNSAIVTLQTGVLVLAYEIPLTMLHAQCSGFLERTEI